MDRRASPVALLALVLLLAGCASPSSDPGEDDPADETGDEGTRPTTPTGATSGGSDGDDPSASERWHGFDFGQRVTPATGGAGTIRSFDARMTQENDGERTVYDLHVEVGAVSTRDIRTKVMSFGGGTAPTEETRTTPLEVRELKHTITVVQDDSGELEAGDELVFVGYEPVSEAAASGTFLLGYAAMEWTDEEGQEGLMEYYVPPGEDPPEGSVFLPYQEGERDFSGHWAFGLFGMAYNPVWLAGWSEGDQEFEEGSYSFGGHSYEIVRKTLTVGGYTFQGWHVQWSAASQGATATWSFDVATSLPIPVAYHFGGSDTSGGSSESWTWELRGLSLG